MKPLSLRKPVFTPLPGGRIAVLVSPDGHRIHRLCDDAPSPLRQIAPAIRRDPMVAALFGPARRATPP